MNTASDDEEREKSGSASVRSSALTREITVVGDRIISRDLFASGRQVVIEHNNEIYILRLTAQNKLILTK